MANDDPACSQFLKGCTYEEGMKSAGLRLGGVEKSFDDHCVVIGDAAGFIDPMTGEGIHHAMDSGRIAANVILEAMKAGNYSAYDIYQDHWMDAFGFDFRWSMKMCLLTYQYPILLDTATNAVIRKGNTMLAKWADIMTGRVPKLNLLRPEYALVIGFELAKLIIKRIFGLSTAPTQSGDALKGGAVPAEVLGAAAEQKDKKKQ